MTKQHHTPQVSVAPLPVIPTDSAHNELQSVTKNSHWLLKAAKANKLGKYSEGSIAYQVHADIDRADLFINITGNNGGGYYSRERVSIQKIEACLGKYETGKPFPSKVLKDAFVGRSSNNAGFMVAVLRAEGLLCVAPDVETQHALAGDWAAWKKAMLAESGTLIEADSDQVSTHPIIAQTDAEQSGHRKTQKQPAAKKA